MDARGKPPVVLEQAAIADTNNAEQFLRVPGRIHLLPKRMSDFHLVRFGSRAPAVVDKFYPHLRTVEVGSSPRPPSRMT